MDTDEDDGAAEPDFAPYDKSLKKKLGVGSRTVGLGTNNTLRGRQILNEDDEGYERDGMRQFDTD